MKMLSAEVEPGKGKTTGTHSLDLQKDNLLKRVGSLSGRI